jgi:hypothetical protein
MKQISNDQRDAMVDALDGAKQIASVAETAMCIRRRTPGGPWELEPKEGDRLNYFARDLLERVENVERLFLKIVDFDASSPPT